MKASIFEIELTQSLIRCNTVNPPGNETACAAVVAPLLQEAGFTVESHDLSPRRTNLVGYLGAGDGQPFALQSTWIPCL